MIKAGMILIVVGFAAIGGGLWLLNLYYEDQATIIMMLFKVGVVLICAGLVTAVTGGVKRML